VFVILVVDKMNKKPLYLYSVKPQFLKSQQGTKQLNNIIMKHAKFINFKAISEELTGKPQKIRQKDTALKYIDILEDLDDVFNLWLKLARKKLNPAPKPKIKRNTSGLKRGISHE
jgi:hypothetical protein